LIKTIIDQTIFISQSNFRLLKLLPPKKLILRPISFELILLYKEQKRFRELIIKLQSKTH